MSMFGVCILPVIIYTRAIARAVVVIVGRRRRWDGCGFSGDDEFMATGNSRRPPYVFILYIHILDFLSPLERAYVRLGVCVCVFVNFDFRWPRWRHELYVLTKLQRYRGQKGHSRWRSWCEGKIRKHRRPRYKNNCSGAPRKTVGRGVLVHPLLPQ